MIEADHQEDSIPQAVCGSWDVVSVAAIWAKRWGLRGVLIGAIGMFWIVLPYNDWGAQLIIKGALGGFLGAGVGLIGGALDTFVRRTTDRGARWAGVFLIVGGAAVTAALAWAFAVSIAR